MRQVEQVGGHTVAWPDGLEITRICVERGQMYLRITWNGVTRELRLGARVGEFITPETRGVSRSKPEQI